MVVDPERRDLDPGRLIHPSTANFEAAEALVNSTPEARPAVDEIVMSAPRCRRLVACWPTDSNCAVASVLPARGIPTHPYGTSESWHARQDSSALGPSDARAGVSWRPAAARQRAKQAGAPGRTRTCGPRLRGPWV
jgi:hypothetical protein